MPTRRAVIRSGSAAIGLAAQWLVTRSLGPSGIGGSADAVDSPHGERVRADSLLGSAEREDLVRRKAVLAILRRKGDTDLRSFRAHSASSVARALRESNSSLSASHVISGQNLRHRSPQILDAIDYEGREDPAVHARILAAMTEEVTVSCAPLFVGGALALWSLKPKLKRYGVKLTIDDRAISSKEQIRHLCSGDGADLAMMAESAFFLAPAELGVASRYFRVLPCYQQEDCLLTVEGSGEPNWASKIYFHHESTAEVLLRSGPIWARPSTRNAFDTAADIAPLVASLDRGAFVTSWEPITSSLTAAYRDIVVVPGSRFNGFVSLFAQKEWLHPQRRPALAAIVSLLLTEWRGMRRTHTQLPELPERVFDTIDRLCGVSLLTDGWNL